VTQTNESGSTIEREFALVTVRFGARATLDDVWSVARRHGARIVDAVSGAATVEAAGAPSVVTACAAALAAFGDCEVARTAPLAVPRLAPESDARTNDEAAAAGRGLRRMA
jgi:acetolactate synthase small subunit